MNKPITLDDLRLSDAAFAAMCEQQAAAMMEEIEESTHIGFWRRCELIELAARLRVRARELRS